MAYLNNSTSKTLTSLVMLFLIFSFVSSFPFNVKLEEDSNIVKHDSNDQKEFIKNMMLHAWKSYTKYAWGQNELKPLAMTGFSQAIFGGEKMAASIVDAADTLYIMGLHDEFQKAHEFIKANFSMKNADQVLSTFETTIRFMGSFLSLYALTDDQMYIEKAKEVADALAPAFNSKTGIAYSLVDVQKRKAFDYNWIPESAGILAEFGTLHLEFVYLSELTGDPSYRQKVEKIRNVLDQADKKDGLYSNYVSVDTGKFVRSSVSLGAMGDSFYEYLLKSYFQSNYKDTQAFRMYKAASEAIRKHMIFTSKGGLRYVTELEDGLPNHRFSHLACFVPGMFALEAEIEEDEGEKQKIMQLAEDLGHTCHESYVRSNTGLGPEVFYFNDHEEATSKSGNNGYIQRPEAIEGWFYLWRLTGKEKYRQWVWDAVQSIEKYLRTETGYVGLKNVYSPDEGKDDLQQSFYLAETLKYAYLTFSDEALPLKDWVFNTEAHPMRINFK